MTCLHWVDPDGGGGTGCPDPPPPPPWKITFFCFVAILVRIPWKITKLPSQHLMLGHHRPASETPFKWRFADGPTMARYSGIWILSSLIKNKKKSYSSWTPSGKTFWIRACSRSCFSEGLSHTYWCKKYGIAHCVLYRVSKLWCISVPEECLFLAKRADPDEMQHFCMGIRYAKLFEAAKTMFKSWDSRAVWTWLLLEKA